MKYRLLSITLGPIVIFLLAIELVADVIQHQCSAMVSRIDDILFAACKRDDQTRTL